MKIFRRKIPIKHRLEIYKSAQEIYKSGKYRGLCACLYDAGGLILHEELDTYALFLKCLPEFLDNKPKIRTVYKGGALKINYLLSYWWDPLDTESREKYMQHIIKLTENAKS